MERKRRRASAALGAVAAVLVVAPPAWGHETGVKWIKLTPGTSSSARSVEYGHTSHKLTIIAYFGGVRKTRLYLDRLVFKYRSVDPRCIFGGKAWVWNSSLQVTYDADRSRTYCSSGSYKLPIGRTFYGGQSNGKASVTVQKNSADGYSSASQSHRSNVVFYVP